MGRTAFSLQCVCVLAIDLTLIQMCWREYTIFMLTTTRIQTGVLITYAHNTYNIYTQTYVTLLQYR